MIPKVVKIYNDWLERHKGTEAISGSRAADMKAAIVDAFKSDEKSILIATESGAEGINLQFCSLLVNFDLSGIPSVLNKSIGRCHRVWSEDRCSCGQSFNRKNRAEARVYELLESKFQFSAVSLVLSDEVLGVIESGIDFEKSVLNIFQSARTDEEIQKEFDFLQENLQDKIDKDLKDARNKIFASFDEQVVTKLPRKGAIDTVLDNFTRSLITIAKAELPDASFDPEGKPI